MFFWSGVPTIIPEIKWLTLGEKLAQGGVMYRDVWDNTPPLAAFVYKWLFIFFGKSTTPYRILSIILVFFQAGIFNNMLLKNKAYNQNTYVAALIYMLFMNLSFDFFTLSPVLMAMTFILLATNNLFKRMDNKSKDEMFVQIGLYLGIATLFFLPSILYFLITILSLLIYTGSIFRRMMLLVYGFGVILTLAFAYYYWYDALGAFSVQFITSVLRIETINYISFFELCLLIAVPFLIFVVSLFKMNQKGRFINFQIKIQRVMLFFFLSGIVAMTMVKDFATYQLIYFIPSVAFFVAHYILTIRNWLVAEVTFLFILLLIFVNNLLPLKKYLHIDRFANYDNLIVRQSTHYKLTKGKKILIIGEEINEYYDSKLSTPYLNWQYAKYHLSSPDYYDNLTAIYQHFTKDMPEVILDEKGVIPALFEKMPTIQSRYSLQSDNVYILNQ